MVTCGKCMQRRETRHTLFLRRETYKVFNFRAITINCKQVNNPQPVKDSLSTVESSINLAAAGSCD